ncbi:DNA repair protein RecN (Recombination protein N) [Propionispira arboris]|uniref:DNA repair protein RecN n=1 Tax=Propionispira arboris TaxID=84035 RepID=A0A1H6VQK6_9FIRM|nr:DNA repair protein RecN [Propionispira arboris]SEJ06919.1 DNA repair protein RecN (Recombination protein N) [Propionispira arboris]
MLKTLTVWNFALLEHVQIEFERGLNILTGETGAGKSILIDSLGMILGHRTSIEKIRKDRDWLRVEAVFDTSKYPQVHDFLQRSDIVDEDDSLIISRQIAKTGKNTIQVNGCHVTLTSLKMLGELLIDIHGQNENQALLRTENQFALVDAYKIEIKTCLAVYQTAFVKWNELKESLKQQELDSREHAQRMDMLSWQVNEIEAAKLKEAEDEGLEQEIKLLSNAEKISDLVKSSYRLLDSGDKRQPAVIPSLVEIKKNMEMLIRYDTKLTNVMQMITDALCQIEECSYEIRDYGESIDYSPERLNKLQERMDEIYKLRKKYGATIADVLEHYHNAKKELLAIENYDQRIEDLKYNIVQAEKDLAVKAVALTKLRQSSAELLSADIQKHLLSLGMENARFVIEIKDDAIYHMNGANTIHILFSANLGEDPKPMQKVASGGELSRIALAIKTVCAAKDKIGIMVFDEIDTGIGGKTAQMVAERIAMVAAYKQVLCITHLPQIACMADVHLYIDKQIQNNKTVTQVRPLSTSEQLNEIARMASGIDITAASLDNAMEMLNNAKLKKESFRQNK